MQDINVKFKDAPPNATVAKIKAILNEMGISVTEKWNDSGIENCWSLHLTADNVFAFSTNGKGITRELAQASAYAEFIERLQCGLLLYKYQSIIREPALDMQSYAPDGKYVTMQELIDDGDWMDYIIQSIGGDLTRKKIAQLCQVYACTDRDAIWVVPFYSIFEKKYVYLPSHFVEQIYCSNGCCAGNTREEAWVHALSEILERHNTIDVLTSGKSVPKISESVIRQYPVASKILDAVQKNPMLDLDVLDLSQGLDYPIIATRLINKATHGYYVNVGCDPIFEIALDRTLTELFQGRNIAKLDSMHNAVVYEELQNPSMEHNLFNQLEAGYGKFYANFFIDNPVSEQSFMHFTDHSSKTNKELLAHVLDVYKKLNHPVYIRNYSYLGFPSYFVVVPGFSETRGLVLRSPVSEYALGDAVQPAFRNPEAVSIIDLQLLLNHYKGMSARLSMINNFRSFAGLPLNLSLNPQLMCATLAFAAYKLSRFADATNYLRPLTTMQSLSQETRDYFACVSHYLRLKTQKVEDEKIHCLLRKFYNSTNVDKLLTSIRNYGNPLHDYLLRCDTKNCEQCKIREHCSYSDCCSIFKTLGERYRAFTHGQAESEFL